MVDWPCILLGLRNLSGNLSLRWEFCLDSLYRVVSLVPAILLPSPVGTLNLKPVVVYLLGDGMQQSAQK